METVMDRTDETPEEHHINYVNYLLSKSGWEALAGYYLFADEHDAKLAELQRVQEGRPS